MIFLLCSCFKYLCCVSDYFQTVFLISEFFLGFTVIFLAVLLDLHQFCDDQLNWAESFCTKKKKRTRKWEDLFQWIRTFTFSPFQFFFLKYIFLWKVSWLGESILKVMSMSTPTDFIWIWKAAHPYFCIFCGIFTAPPFSCK